MGTLKYFNYDLNDPVVVQSLLGILRNYLISTPTAYYKLTHKPPYYFSINNGPITTHPGWYIILDGKVPVYVGTAENLDNRLNSDNGSIDNFGLSTRTKDSERNFIKKFSETGVINDLRVVIIPTSALSNGTISDNDRKELEKLINIFRCTFQYK